MTLTSPLTTHRAQMASMTSQWRTRKCQQYMKSSGLRVKSSTKAGGLSFNHNRAVLGFSVNHNRALLAV